MEGAFFRLIGIRFQAKGLPYLREVLPKFKLRHGNLKVELHKL